MAPRKPVIASAAKQSPAAATRHPREIAAAPCGRLAMTVPSIQHGPALAEAAAFAGAPWVKRLTSRPPFPNQRPACPGGGIGRRAGFRYLWPKGRGSSSLLLGTRSFRASRPDGVSG